MTKWLQHPELSDRNDYAFEVRDNGKGIEADQMAKLFDPFFTTKAPGQGTGLGLPMVYGAIRDHQGAVWAESASGQGAVFFLLLPLLEEIGAAESEDTGDVVRGSGETLLLVEDEATVREMHCRRLLRLGYNVVTACDADDALKKFSEAGEIVDLLLLDVILPGKDGVFVAESIRVDTPSIPVLFLGGYATGRAVRWVRENHRTRLLKKPAAGELLSRTLHGLLYPDESNTANGDPKSDEIME